MDVTIRFLDEMSCNDRTKRIIVIVEEPVSIKSLFELAGIQEGKPSLPRELESFMISYQGSLLNHGEALNKIIMPGEEILLVSLMEGG